MSPGMQSLLEGIHIQAGPVILAGLGIEKEFSTTRCTVCAQSMHSGQRHVVIWLSSGLRRYGHHHRCEVSWPNKLFMIKENKNNFDIAMELWFHIAILSDIITQKNMIKLPFWGGGKKTLV